MFKKLIFIFAIVMVAFSQSVINIQTSAVGGYASLNQKQLNQLLQTDDFNNVVKAATTYWQQTYNEGLGKIINVQKQLVSGFNYKITFKSQPTSSYSQAVVVVYDQPWTNTIQVTDAWTEPKQGNNLTRN